MISERVNAVADVGAGLIVLPTTRDRDADDGVVGERDTTTSGVRTLLDVEADDPKRRVSGTRNYPRSTT